MLIATPCFLSAHERGQLGLMDYLAGPGDEWESRLKARLQVQVNEHRRAERWTALLFLRTPKPKELQQLRALSAPKFHRHRRFCEMALPIILLSACELPSCSKGPVCLPFQ